MNPEITKKNFFIKFCLAAIIWVPVLAAISYYFNKDDKGNNPYYHLVNASEKINKTCPMMLDSETQLDHTSVTPTNEFQIYYNLVTIDKGEIDSAVAQKTIAPRTLNHLQTDSGNQLFRANRVPISYTFRDKHGSYIFKLSFKPEQYCK